MIFKFVEAQERKLNVKNFQFFLELNYKKAFVFSVFDMSQNQIYMVNQKNLPPNIFWVTRISAVTRIFLKGGRPQGKYKVISKKILNEYHREEFDFVF